ncbi:glycosyltransferase family 31 protein [Gonapodya prolifera JEL478]|uniref:Glycosyltransferase family 31 protein n=1 Tax=Gonapodya prolifera (strain JEL478) TaxID=1344416 RepID=A0A139AN84_GONPJ|nr:glycosyltransferase family 31 protein [Gonapodya prolifera JEL478]|eukprot:KXS18094.1 glycosyltransferase family 31 protein [Gonapodya prolifera JEL478]
MVDDDTHTYIRTLFFELGRLDETRPVYLGRATQFSDCGGVSDPRDSIWMAQGGAGIILSRPALTLLIQTLPTCLSRTSSCWAGDIRLALCLQDAGVFLARDQRFFDVFYSRSPEDVGFPWPKDPCVRPGTFHGVSPTSFPLLHALQRSSPSREPRIADVFHLLYPSADRVPSSIPDTYLSHPAFRTLQVAGMDECRRQCVEEPRCRTWSFEPREGGGRRPDAGGACGLKKEQGWGGERRVGVVSGAVWGRYGCN